MQFPSTLRQSLTLNFVVVAVLPILLLGVFGFQYFKKEHLKATFSLLDAHALSVSQEANELLRDTNANLNLIAKTLNSGLLHNDAEINQYLQIAINDSNNFESIYHLNEDRRVTHLGLSVNNDNSREDYIGFDLSVHEIFTSQPLLSGATWSETFLSTITAEPSISLGIPLNNGTLLGTVSLQKISAELVDYVH